MIYPRTMFLFFFCMFCTSVRADECGTAIVCEGDNGEEPVCTAAPPVGATSYITKNGSKGPCIKQLTGCDGGEEEATNVHSLRLQDGNSKCDVDADDYNDDECHVLVEGSGSGFLSFPGLPLSFNLPGCENVDALRSQILGFLGDALDGENIKVLSVSFGDIAVTEVEDDSEEGTSKTLRIEYQPSFMLDVCFVEQQEIENGVDLTITPEKLQECGCPRGGQGEPSAPRRKCTITEEMLCKSCSGLGYCYCPCKPEMRRPTRDDVICRINSVSGFGAIDSVISTVVFDGTCTQFGECEGAEE